jgi:ABC-type glycerol-3-phosphate transport system permease component
VTGRSFRLGSIVPYALTIALAALFALPALWALMASLSTNQQITLNSLEPPSRLHFENYSYAWRQAQIGTFVINSLIVAVTSAITITIMATLAGYALGKLYFPGRTLVMLVLISAIIMPVFSYIVPLSRLFRDVGLTNSLTPVIIATSAIFLPVPTLLMRSFFRQLPDEIADAARVEGASEWQVFHQIMAPLARPGILTSLIFAFVWAWNDVLLPIVFIQNPDKFTIPSGIAALRPAAFRQDYVSIFAASMISTIPMILIWLFLQRRLIAGLTLGASKG